MGGFRGLLVGTILIMLFALSMYMFAGQFIGQSNPNSTILNDPDHNLNATVSSLTNTLNVQYNSSLAKAINATNTASLQPLSFVFLIWEGAFTIPKMFFAVIMTSMNLIPSLISGDLFPNSPGNPVYIIKTVLVMIISITAIFFFIKFIRGGESEH